MTRSIALLLALASTLLAGSALACSCAFEETELLAPADGATDVPVNARIWVGAGTANWGQGAVTLTGEAGAEVAATVSDLSGNNERIIVLAPAADLDAGAAYEVRVDDEVIGSFVAGAEADDAPPEVPGELEREATSSARVPGMANSCGPTDVVTLDLEPTGHVLIASLQGEDTVDVEAIDGEAADVSLDGLLRIGSAGCTWSWTDAAPGASTGVRWGAFDLAGNFSGWSDEVTVTVPPAGCTCSSVGSPASGLAGLMLLGLVVLRRR